ncbi:beta-propeller domain-containing protein [Candidatus Woesearchaeota archaeon]|nr:beta-propeller domain-containing protein [Candidatus Woesearchaeota archaeon]
MEKKIVSATLLAIFVVAMVSAALFFATTESDLAESNQLKKFSSYDELKDFLKTNRERVSYGYGGFGFGRIVTKAQTFATATGALESTSAAPSGSEDYSATNIQVAGVDEADIVKNDGKYIYAIAGNKLVIVDAYPAENAKVISETALKGYPTEIFVNNDKLVVFAQDYSYSTQPLEKTFEETKGVSTASPTIARPYSGTLTRIDVYDISSRESPVLARSIVVSGNYFDSRMIEDYVYAVVNQPVYYDELQPPPFPEIAENGAVKKIAAQDIYYFDVPDYSYNYVNIIAVNTQTDEEEYNSKTFLAGSTQNMYVSLGNIYVTYTGRNNFYATDSIIDQVVVPILPGAVGAKIGEIRKSALDVSEKMRQISEELNSYTSSLSQEERDEFEKKAQQRMIGFEEKLAKETEKTVVHKIAISDGAIDYKGQGLVPGHVLNQFSMDEHKGYFRIATTTGEVSRFEGGAKSQNHIYVLDESLKVVGSVEDLAPGEKIYSARFMGDRAYMVTFKKVDPLFVIDLSEPTNPKVLGKLKIPGYSDYLHPYDENHIIGLGKEAAEAETEGGREANFAWYQGIKIALFDVSDPENPREVSKYNIGDRGTDSYALQDHKAFLFSRQKNLLVIPIQLAEIDESRYSGGKLPPNAYGDFVWQGAYVLSLDTENGFKLKGRVTHLDTEEGEQKLLKSGYYFRSEYDVKRSLYMDDVLYTLSDRMIKMNKLEDLEEVNRVRLPNGENQKRFRGV